METSFNRSRRFCSRDTRLRVWLGLAVLSASASLHATPVRALSFNLNPSFDTTTTEGTAVLAGFQAAAGLWSGLFTDNVTVNLDIGFQALEDGVLGDALSNTLESDYVDIFNALGGDALSADDALAVAHLQTDPFLDFLMTDPFTGTTVRDNDGSTNNAVLAVNRANAKALGLLDANDAGVDAEISLNSNFSFDFDRSNGIGAGLFDFIGVAAHEIGHALGFSSGVDEIDCWSNVLACFQDEPDIPDTEPHDPYPTFNVLDLFRYSTESTALGILDLAAGSDAYFSLDGGTTNLGDFSTGEFNGDGYQASHWKDNLGLGLMDPTLSLGEFGDITALDIRAFDAIGWDRPQQKVPEPATALALLGVGFLAARTLCHRETA